MAFSGSLQEFSMSEIFNLFAQQRKTGLLTATRGTQKAELELSAGTVIQVSVGTDNPESIVKNVLIRTGRVDERLYEELSASAQRTGKSIRQLMVSKNYLTDEENASWYKIAMEDLTLSLFFWNDGEYNFESRKNPVLMEDTNFALPMDYLTLEGVRQVDEWPDIINRFPEEKLVFKIKEKGYQEYDLEEGKFLMDRIDGRKSLATLQKEVPFGAYRFFSYLSKLWDEGFIEVEENAKDIDVTEIISEKKQKINTRATVLTLVALLLIACSLFIRMKFLPMAYKSSTRIAAIQAERNMTLLKLSTLEFALEKGSLPQNFAALSDYSREIASVRKTFSDSLKTGFPGALLW